MGPTVIDGGSTPSTDHFDNGNTALVTWGGGDGGRSSPTELGLTGQRPVLLVVGGADAGSRRANVATPARARCHPGCGRGRAAILDGGTQLGVMSARLGVIGQRRHGGPRRRGAGGKVPFPATAGRAAESRTPLDPNHTHFLLAHSDDWGGETSLMFDALDGLDRDSPAAVLIAGGGPVGLDEVAARSARGLHDRCDLGHGWGRGPAVEGGPRPTPWQVWTRRESPRLTAAADVAVVELNADPGQLAHLLARLLHVDETLRDAWLRQALVSAAAERRAGLFRQRAKPDPASWACILTSLVVANSVLLGRWPAPGGLTGADRPLLRDPGYPDRRGGCGRRSGPASARDPMDFPARDVRDHQARDLPYGRARGSTATRRPPTSCVRRSLR